jgi:peptidase MA superfamily protein/tetratricopeptide repeat protein
MLTLLLLTALAGAPQAISQDPARAGWEAIQRGDGETAASAFRAILAKNPRDSRALAGAAIASHLLGHDDEAISTLKRALVINPDDVYALYLLGPLAYSQGDSDLAIKSYEHIVKVAPGNQTVRQQLEDWKKEAALHDTFTVAPMARFAVMFEGPEQQAIASHVSKTLDAAYTRVGQALGAWPPQTVTTILYTQEQFRDITKSPSWAAGAYDGRIRIPVRGALSNTAELDRVVTHEFTHAVIHQVFPGIPYWMNEGLATYMEPTDHTWLTSKLRAGGGVIPLDRLTQAFQTSDGGDAAVAYAEAYVGVQVMAERLGPNFSVFLQSVSNGATLDQALMVFGLSAADIEKEWTRRARTAR